MFCGSNIQNAVLKSFSWLFLSSFETQICDPTPHYAHETVHISS